MKTIEDLPFLKAQAAELERLIAIAPPTAVIAKYQYEEQVSMVREEIARLEKATQLPDQVLEDAKYLKRVRRACLLVTTRQLQTLNDERDRSHIPSVLNLLHLNQLSLDVVETSLHEVSEASHLIVNSISAWKTMLSACIRQLSESQSEVSMSTGDPLYELVFHDLFDRLKDVQEKLARALESTNSDTSQDCREVRNELAQELDRVESQTPPHKDCIVKLFTLAIQA